MKGPGLACFASVALLIQLTGCGFVHDKKLVGPYRLVAVDTSEDMSICFALDGGACVGRIPETVFSVGWNERFLIAKQHPNNDRSVTNYFILDMAKDGKFQDPAKSVLGPLSKQAFDKQASVLKLPAFAKTIHELE